MWALPSTTGVGVIYDRNVSDSIRKPEDDLRGCQWPLTCIHHQKYIISNHFNIFGTWRLKVTFIQATRTVFKETIPSPHILVSEFTTLLLN